MDLDWVKKERERKRQKEEETNHVIGSVLLLIFSFGDFKDKEAQLLETGLFVFSIGERDRNKREKSNKFTFCF